MAVISVSFRQTLNNILENLYNEFFRHTAEQHDVIFTAFPRRQLYFKKQCGRDCVTGPHGAAGVGAGSAGRGARADAGGGAAGDKTPPEGEESPLRAGLS